MINCDIKAPVCPFYKGDTGKSIKCNGVISKGCIKHCITSNRKKQKHKEFYCNTDNYKKCQYAVGLLPE